MIVNLIQTGTHNGEEVRVYDITEGLETIGTVTIRIKEKQAVKVAGIETAIKKHIEKAH